MKKILALFLLSAAPLCAQTDRLTVNPNTGEVLAPAPSVFFSNPTNVNAMATGLGLGTAAYENAGSFVYADDGVANRMTISSGTFTFPYIDTGTINSVNIENSQIIDGSLSGFTSLQTTLGGPGSITIDGTISAANFSGSFTGTSIGLHTGTSTGLHTGTSTGLHTGTSVGGNFGDQFQAVAGLTIIGNSGTATGAAGAIGTSGFAFSGSTVSVIPASTGSAGVVMLSTGSSDIATGTNTTLATTPSAVASAWTWFKTQAQTFANLVVTSLTVNDSNPTAPNLTTMASASTFANRRSGDDRWAVGNSVTYPAASFVNTGAVTVAYPGGPLPFSGAPAAQFPDAALKTVVMPIPQNWTGTVAFRALVEKASGTNSPAAAVVSWDGSGIALTASGSNDIPGTTLGGFSSTVSFPSGTSRGWVWISGTFVTQSNTSYMRTFVIGRDGTAGADTMNGETLFIPIVILDRLSY